MADGRIPKDLLYDELATASKALGHPNLRFKDVCKWDMKFMGTKLIGGRSMSKIRLPRVKNFEKAPRGERLC